MRYSYSRWTERWERWWGGNEEIKSQILPSGQDEITGIRFTFLTETTKKWTKYRKWL